MAAFSAGATFVWSRNTAPVPSGDRCKSTAPHYRMYSDDDPYVDGAAAFSEDRQHRLREVMFYLNLSEQEKMRFVNASAFAC